MRPRVMASSGKAMSESGLDATKASRMRRSISASVPAHGQAGGDHRPHGGAGEEVDGHLRARPGRGRRRDGRRPSPRRRPAPAPPSCRCRRAPGAPGPTRRPPGPGTAARRGRRPASVRTRCGRPAPAGWTRMTSSSRWLRIAAVAKGMGAAGAVGVRRRHQDQAVDLAGAVGGESGVPALGGHQHEVVLHLQRMQPGGRSLVRLGAQHRHLGAQRAHGGGQAFGRGRAWRRRR